MCLVIKKKGLPLEAFFVVMARYECVRYTKCTFVCRRGRRRFLLSVKVRAKGVGIFVLNIIADENCFRLMWLVTC